MSSKEQTHSSNDKTNSKRRSPKPATENLDKLAQQPTHSDTFIQPARIDLDRLNPRQVLQLQHTIGNQAVQRLLQSKTEDLEARPVSKASTAFADDFSRLPMHTSVHSSKQPKLKVNGSGDQHEQEADWVANQAMQMPEPQVQRQPKEEGEVLQSKFTPGDAAARQRALTEASPDRLRPDHLASRQRSLGNWAATSALSVQRRPDDEELDAPYQAKMDPKSSTLITDQLGNAAAAGATPKSMPVEGRVGKPSFGMFEPAEFPLDPSLKGQTYFSRLMEETLTAWFYGRSTVADKKKTFAYRTQNVGLGNYAKDADLIPKAQQSFNIFVPLANAATRAVVKAATVAQDLWINEEGWDVSTDLSKGEQLALKDAMAKYQIDNDKVSAATKNVSAHRKSLVAASRDMARLTEHQVIGKLRTIQEKAEAGKAAIQAKINKIAKVAGYVQTGVSLVAGGSTKLIALASAGAEAEASTDPSKRISGGAAKINKATGMLSKAATFGMQLYYDKELTDLEVKIETLGDEIEHHAGIEEKNKWDAIKFRFDAAIEHYRNAVEELQNAVMDRRETMALIGAEADRLAKGRNKGADRGRDTDIASRTLLFATTVLETKTLLAAALDAGKAADDEVGRVYGHIQSWRGGYGVGIDPHPDSPDPFYYQLAKDAYAAPIRRIPGLKGADFKAIAAARNQLYSWLMGADEIDKVLDSWIGSDGPTGSGIKKLLGDANWSGGEY